MKKIFVFFMLIGLTSCASSKVTSKRECQFICLNEFHDMEKVKGDTCYCQRREPVDPKK